MWSVFVSPQGQMVARPSIAAEPKVLLLALTMQDWLGAAVHAMALNTADSAAALNIIFKGARQRRRGTQANIWPDYQASHKAASSKLSSMYLSPADLCTAHPLFLKDQHQHQQAGQASIWPEMPTQPVPELGQINYPADHPTQPLTELDKGMERSAYPPTWDAAPGNSHARIRNSSLGDQVHVEDLVLWLHGQVSHQQC